MVHKAARKWYRIQQYCSKFERNPHVPHLPAYTRRQCEAIHYVCDHVHILQPWRLSADELQTTMTQHQATQQLRKIQCPPPRRLPRPQPRLQRQLTTAARRWPALPAGACGTRFAVAPIAVRHRMCCHAWTIIHRDKCAYMIFPLSYGHMIYIRKILLPICTLRACPS